MQRHCDVAIVGAGIVGIATAYYLKKLKPLISVVLIDSGQPMGFARRVADRVIFMDEGEIVEQNDPETFFNSPNNERTKLFLSQILQH